MLGDEAPWIWELASQFFPYATQILDWYHLTEHLGTAAKVVHGERTPETTALFEQWQTEVREGRSEGVEEHLRELWRQARTTQITRCANAPIIAKLTKPESAITCSARMGGRRDRESWKELANMSWACVSNDRAPDGPGLEHGRSSTFQLKLFNRHGVLMIGRQGGHAGGDGLVAASDNSDVVAGRESHVRKHSTYMAVPPMVMMLLGIICLFLMSGLANLAL